MEEEGWVGGWGAGGGQESLGEKREWLGGGGGEKREWERRGGRVGGWMGEGRRERGVKREWERRVGGWGKAGDSGVRKENLRGGGGVGVWMGEDRRERGEKREWGEGGRGSGIKIRRWIQT